MGGALPELHKADEEVATVIEKNCACDYALIGSSLYAAIPLTPNLSPDASGRGSGRAATL